MGGLQTFLRRMESLEFLVESSELQLKAVVNQKDDDSAQFLVPPTQLTMKLSFYDLALISDPALHGSKALPS